MEIIGTYIVLIVPEEGRLYPYFAEFDPTDPHQEGLSINEEIGMWSFKGVGVSRKQNIGQIAKGTLRYNGVVGVFPKPAECSSITLNTFAQHTRMASV